MYLGELHVDLIVRIQTLSLSDAGCSDLVVVAAAGGDLDTLTKYLRYHPEHVSITLSELRYYIRFITAEVF